ncbi:MAG: helix-turn-helix domain-containing protein [Alphaproteobacteria bacterium]
MKTFAERMKSIRGYLSLSRKEFSERFGIPEPTLRSWELSKTTISKLQLKKLTEALGRGNLSCSESWLLHGDGESPFSARDPFQAHLAKFEKDTLDTLQRDSLSKRVEILFKLYYPNGILFQIESEHFAPFFQKEDLIFAIEEDPSQIQFGFPYICELENNERILQFIFQNEAGDRIFLDSYPQSPVAFNAFKKNVPLVKLYRILFISKPFNR